MDTSHLQKQLAESIAKHLATTIPGSGVQVGPLGGNVDCIAFAVRIYAPDARATWPRDCVSAEHGATDPGGGDDSGDPGAGRMMRRRYPLTPGAA